MRERSAWQELQLGWDLLWMFYQWNETQTAQAGKGKATFPGLCQRKAGHSWLWSLLPVVLTNALWEYSTDLTARAERGKKKSEKEKILVPSAPFLLAGAIWIWAGRWSSLVEVWGRAEKRALPRVPSTLVSQLVAL